MGSKTKNDMRKTIFIVIGILVVTSVGLWYMLSRNSKTYTKNSAFRAVSQRSPLVIEVSDVEEFLITLHNDSDIMKQLQSSGFLDKFDKQINWFRSNLDKSEDLRHFLDDKDVLISYNHQGKDGIVPTYCFSLEKPIEADNILKSLKKYARENDLKHTNIIYDRQELHSIDFPMIGTQFFSCYNGIFVMSRSRLLVEESIRQIDSANLTQDKKFADLYSTVSHSSLFNIFINHEQIPTLLNRIINKDYRSTVNDIATFAHWSEYDVINKHNQFWLNGYSTIAEQHDNYLSVFMQQKPQRFRMDHVISSNTALFIDLNLDDFNQFQDNYASFLKQQSKSYYERETRLLAIEKQTGKKITGLFDTISDHDFALVFGSVIQNQLDANRYFIVKAKSKSIARDELMPILEKNAHNKGVELESLTTTYKLDEKESYDIYQFPIPDCASVLFGQVFAGASCNYLCFYDNYLIFADSETAMKSYIHDLVLHATLSEDSNFKRFNREMNSSSNVYAYLNFSKFFNAHTQYLDQKSSKFTDENEASIRKFQAIGWQISTVEDKCMNNIYLNFDPKLKEDPQTVWISQLDAPINIKPQLVYNHLVHENKEVIVQDDANNLYLINKEGVQLWKIKLTGKIIGGIHQIDIYRNKRLQYVFNTQDKLYILDRNGNNVGKFPVSFRSPATNGVAVFDYANNSNYRFFVACKNKQTYAYNKEGNIVTGWKAAKTDAFVTKPIQHKVISDKDYIFYTDLHNTYILSRTGESRNDKVERFEHSDNDIYLINTEGKPAIATTDTDGIIHMQFIDGSYKTVKFTNFGKNHKFVAHDLNNDGYDDFIFAAKRTLVAFDSSGKKLFEVKFDSAISTTPNIFSFDKDDVKIGITTSNDNQIHLITSKGEEYDGFPLQGNTDFSIGKFSNNQEYFNILVGNNNNGFLNYMVQ